jgi:hypothetical protein
MADFVVRSEGGYLDRFLAYRKENGEIVSPAMREENDAIARTYLVLDRDTEELVAYFSLRAGQIGINTKSNGRFLRRNEFEPVPGIELANFAKNERYVKAHPEYKGLGYVIFEEFILPIVKNISKMVGVKILYIYALPRKNLIDHYKTYGFTKLEPSLQKYVERRFRPRYDRGCAFMYLIL